MKERRFTWGRTLTFCVLPWAVVACTSPYARLDHIQPGYVTTAARARTAYALEDDTIKEVTGRDVSDTIRRISEGAADSAHLDPYCSRFFVSSGTKVIVMFRLSCDLPQVSLSDNAIAFAVYDSKAGMGPLLEDWRPWFPAVCPMWQPPLDIRKARKTAIHERDK